MSIKVKPCHIDSRILLELTRRKIDIDTLVDELDERNAFVDQDDSAILRDWKKRQVRQAVKAIKDENGIPLIFSIADLDSDGKPARKYKQESLFNLEDYRQVVEQCRRLKKHWSRIEKFLMKRARERFGDETPLFGEKIATHSLS